MERKLFKLVQNDNCVLLFAMLERLQVTSDDEWELHAAEEEKEFR